MRAERLLLNPRPPDDGGSEPPAPSLTPTMNSTTTGERAEPPPPGVIAEAAPTLGLDVDRALAQEPAAAGDRAPSPLSQYRSGYSPAAWVMALGVYIVALLLMLPWVFSPENIEQPIPVQLVLEKPPPPPPAPPLPPQPKPPIEKKPPTGHLASADMGKEAPEAKPATAPERASTPTTETKLEAVAMAVPQLNPTPDVLTLPERERWPFPANAPENPKPEPEKKPTPRPVAARIAPHALPHMAHAPGPDATHDEYLAYCLVLINRYNEMMSPAFLAGRSGMAVLGILVLDDGTIGRVVVEHSSGYRDVDTRAEQMIVAVARFPPLPQWFQGTAMMLEYHMPFYDGRLAR
jgi:TonB family protein